MDNDYLSQRLRKIFVRAPIAVMGATALFWLIWYAIVGYVPKVDFIEFGFVEFGKKIYPLGYSFSRLWDIPISGIFVAIGLLLWYLSEKMDESLFIFKAVVFIASFFAFFSIVVAGLHFGLMVNMFSYVLFSFLFFWLEEVKGNIVVFYQFVVLAFSFAIGLGTFLRFGGVVGLVFFVLAFILYALIKFLIFFVFRD